MATGSTQPFRPAGTASLAASTSSANVALSGGGSAVLVYNASAATAFFLLGASSGLAASTANTPVPPGQRMIVDGGPFVSHAAAVLAAGTGTVYFTLGDGDTY
jgi:hypothetical protein